jgi:hypothetical protein
MLDLRKTRAFARQRGVGQRGRNSSRPRRISTRGTASLGEISLVDGGKDGLFAIIPMSADEAHAGYLMRAESQAAAVEWVAGA